MLDGLGSDATQVAANPQVEDDCALLGKEADPDVVMLPATGDGLLGTRAKQIRALAPLPPVGPVAPVPVGPVGPLLPAYPAETILAVVQLMVLVETVAASVSVTIAVHKVNPAEGDEVIEVLHPDGTGVKLPVDHVYVEVPVGPAGIVTAH